MLTHAARTEARSAPAWRVASYWLVGGGLVLLYAALRGSTWQGSVALHTLMEVAATLLAAVVGAMALVRFYSSKNNTFLFVGTGFLGAAFLDGYHAVVTSVWFAPYLPSDLPALSPWSWIASRLFLSLMLVLSWLAWRRERHLGAAGRIDERTVYLGAGLLTLTSFLFFAVVPLPIAYFPGVVLHRPEELGPALLFLVALVGYLRKGDWRRDAFEHWLVLALIVGLVGQAVFMSFSGRLFDMEFDVAHLLKKVSYLCVLTGLLVSMLAIYRRAEERGDRIRAVVDNAVDGIITIDSDGIIRSFNPAAATIFGHSAEDAIGRNVKFLMPAPYREEHDGYLGSYLRTGDAKIIGIGRELTGLRGDGTTFAMELAVSEVRRGGVREFVGICRDISVRKQAQEELAAANAELESFAYSVSHDLRAPLRAIDGFSEALLQDYGDTLDEDGRGYLQRVRAGSQRMGQLIDAILTLSRVTRGGIGRERVDLSALAQAISAEHQAADPDRVVGIEIAPGLAADGDPRLLRALLENLLGNAWKFTSQAEHAHIAFGMARENGTNTYYVRDNGAGFDMAYADKLFAPFQRLHRVAEFEGTGVGLATVARIVQRHGGRVWADGVVDRGATFNFTLGNQRDPQA